ncbi:hypothetical protein BJ138DRAFT_1161182 [Hygrophoropsis aurantiaca]|uniref:Uncharacterized protein n=1 Tax=Hygrophoropsis aurantiaca TaxID=72124 RepID=A0ACB8A1K8_9AGAM|nr:hypothetical protein BJ138DRAFT_1161182 [Hygrophoropsis aurantiaca]
MSIVNNSAQTTSVSDVHSYSAPPLDESLYNLDPKAASLFKSLTGISDDQSLKEHILRVQADAYKVAPYPCIHRLTFTHMVIPEMPVYSDMLKIGREREGAILLDLGCCVGTDIRKIAFDGYPAENIIGCDLEAEFLTIGHDLFKSTPATFPAHFIPGDVFDPSLLSIVPPHDTAPEALAPNLSDLASLNPLQGRVSIIYTGKFFHLFTKERQLHLARALAGLLSPTPSSIICGAHMGSHNPGLYNFSNGLSKEFTLFCHSPESWTAMWDGEVFKKGFVRVEAILVKYDDIFLEETTQFCVLMWSVTRL